MIIFTYTVKTMNKIQKTLLVLVGVVWFWSGFGLAQNNEDFRMDLQEARDRKEPGFFRRPAKDDAEEQMKHADELKARGSLRKAAKAYKAIVHTWHESSLAVSAQMNYAEILLKRGKHRRSFDEFQYMVEHFAGQFDYNAVLDYQFRIANQLMTMKRGKFFIFPGFTSPERALPLLEQIIENAPDWDNTPQAQFNIGLIHEQAEDYEEAVISYEVVRSRYSDSDYAAGAAFRRAHCLNEMSKLLPRDERQCRLALMAVSGFLRNFTGDPNEETAMKYAEQLKSRLADLSYDIAVYYDKTARKPKAAVIAYSDFVRHFPSSIKAVEADRRRAELEREIGNNE